MDKIEKLREELLQTKLAYQMAVQLSQFKSGFLGRIAHELRSPLSSLIGIHQLILSDLCEGTEEERELLKQGFQTAQKLTAIIDEIVKVSKLECGTLPLEICNIQLAQIFSDLEHLTHLQAANRHLRLAIQHPDPNIFVMADSQWLLQGLVILVDTAISSLESARIEMGTEIFREWKLARIYLDLPCPLSLWQEKEEIDLSQEIQPSPELGQLLHHQVQMSPTTKLLLVQTLLEKMGGKIELLNVPSREDKPRLTRLQCSLPLAASELGDRVED